MLNQNQTYRRVPAPAPRLRDQRVRAPHRPLHPRRSARRTSRSSPTSPCTHRTSPRPRRAQDRRQVPARAGAAHTELRPGRREPHARFVRDLPSVHTAQETTAIDDLYRRRIRSLQAVDRGVARLVHTLRATRQLDNTYIVFASDNGFHLGQHRMPAGKQTAYEPDIHVPLASFAGRACGRRARDPARRQHRPRAHLRGDGGRVHAVVHRRAIARAAPARHPPGHWRHSYLVEHRIESGVSRNRPASPGGSTRRSSRPTPTGDPTVPADAGRSATPCC